ncbi:DNA processing protein DprA, partial [Streptococcus thermophilus]|nr:DNA processing protein DprA [Streptococcus thermophilus]
IAVIGTGLDIFYPLENRKIQEYLAKNQLVLSEYSLGEKPLKYHFPERNRIIAGLSRGVVVVEAKLRSGSLITCERALEEGRDI